MESRVDCNMLYAVGGCKLADHLAISGTISYTDR
jgi:hypothetical protein